MRRLSGNEQHLYNIVVERYKKWGPLRREEFIDFCMCDLPLRQRLPDDKKRRATIIATLTRLRRCGMTEEHISPNIEEDDDEEDLL